MLYYDYNRRIINLSYEVQSRRQSKYCGKVVTIISAFRYGYSLDIDGRHYNWIDEMFEENINDMEQKEIIIPQGWEIDKVDGNKIILKEDKKYLPKTWGECCELLGEGEYINNESIICNYTPHCAASKANENILPTGLGKPMLALMQLLVCREVYRQGWKPNWEDNKIKYCIERVKNCITEETYTLTARVLSFQSAEIRDEFLENFRDLIEEAKELI